MSRVFEYGHCLFRWLYQEGSALEFLSECLWGHEVDLGEYLGQVIDGGDGRKGPRPDVGLADVWPE